MNDSPRPGIWAKILSWTTCILALVISAWGVYQLTFALPKLERIFEDLSIKEMPRITVFFLSFYHSGGAYILMLISLVVLALELFFSGKPWKIGVNGLWACFSFFFLWLGFIAMMQPLIGIVNELSLQSAN